jgi:hypothetical protein
MNNDEKILKALGNLQADVKGLHGKVDGLERKVDSIELKVEAFHAYPYVST